MARQYLWHLKQRLTSRLRLTSTMRLEVSKIKALPFRNALSLISLDWKNIFTWPIWEFCIVSIAFRILIFFKVGYDIQIRLGDH
jgi:hypothetical protein